MSIPLKIFSSIGVLGALSLGLVLANHLSSETIANRLKKVGYQRLGKEVADTKIVLNAYKASQKLLGEIKDEAELKSKCDSMFKKRDEKNYSLASKWCVKEETIMVMLERNKFTPIKGRSANENNSQWEAKLEQLKKAREKGIQVTEDFKKVSDVASLEKACQDLSNLKTHEKDGFEMKYIQTTQWCSEKK